METGQSCDHVFRHRPAQIGQLEVATTVPIRQLILVQTEQVSVFGVQIVDWNCCSAGYTVADPVLPAV